MHTSEPLTVVVMHSRPLLSMGVHTALKREAHLNVRCATTEGSDIEDDTDVVVADYVTAMRIIDEGTAAWRHRKKPRVVIVTMRHRASDIESAIRKGADAYLLAGCEVQELIQGVEAVANGSRFLCASAAQSMAEGILREDLTGRQRDVFELLAVGLSNKQIARKLGVSEGTVKSHMKEVLYKFGAQSRTQAITIAFKRGIITDPSE